MKRKYIIKSALLSSLVGVICITINSKFSFLYCFHDVKDVQCFITVARCMYRGDVLYKDIYEHKGPMHYFLYYLGMTESGMSITRLFLLEMLLFSIFVFFVIRILDLCFVNAMLKYIAAMAVSVWATSAYSFCGGGECEEFALPFITIAIYYAIKPFVGNDKTNGIVNNNWKYPVIIGVCFAMVFWSKYTLVGAFAGYVLAVLTIGIIEKNLKYIVKTGCGFVCGAIAGSIPVIVYFAINGAYINLWEVYFYNLIVKYSKTDYGNSAFFSNLKNISSVWILITLTGIIVMPKKMINVYGKLTVILVEVLEVIGLAAGKMWSYSYEMLIVFSVFLFIGIKGIAQRMLNNNKISGFLKEKKEKYSERLREELKGHIKILRLIHLMRAAFSNSDRSKDCYPEGKIAVFRAGILILSVLYAGYFAYTVSPSTRYMECDLDDYAIYRMSREIMDKVPDSPVILCFTSLDPGLYLLTDTYPPDKYFCKYNLFTPSELGYYEKYIETGIADYIISTADVDDLYKYDYKLVMYAEKACDKIIYDEMPFFLYARKDLAVESY